MRTYFDHEKLEVYNTKVVSIRWLTPLLTKVKESGQAVDRASLSALPNTAEGNGRRRRQIRAEEEIAEGKQLLLRICSMLTKLIARFDQVVGKEVGTYGSEDEDRKKDEDEKKEDV